MPEDSKEYGLDFKCQRCGVAGHFDFAKWQARFTGAMEICCPRCNKISVFIGKFGQDIYLERAMNDAREEIDNVKKG